MKKNNTNKKTPKVKKYLLLLVSTTVLSFNTMALDVSKEDVINEIPKLFKKTEYRYFKGKKLEIDIDSIKLRNPYNPLWYMAVAFTGAEFGRDRYVLEANVKDKITGKISTFDCYVDVIEKEELSDFRYYMYFFVTLPDYITGEGYSCNLTNEEGYSMKIFTNIFKVVYHDFNVESSKSY